MGVERGVIINTTTMSKSEALKVIGELRVRMEDCPTSQRDLYEAGIDLLMEEIVKK